MDAAKIQTIIDISCHRAFLFGDSVSTEVFSFASGTMVSLPHTIKMVGSSIHQRRLIRQYSSLKVAVPYDSLGDEQKEKTLQVYDYSLLAAFSWRKGGDYVLSEHFTFAFVCFCCIPLQTTEPLQYAPSCCAEFLCAISGIKRPSFRFGAFF